MSLALNVSRGSFYWHFRDIACADFRSQVLRSWRDRMTDLVIRDVAGKAGPDRLRHLLKRAFVEKPGWTARSGRGPRWMQGCRDSCVGRCRPGRLHRQLLLRREFKADARCLGQLSCIGPIWVRLCSWTSAIRRFQHRPSMISPTCSRGERTRARSCGALIHCVGVDIMPLRAPSTSGAGPNPTAVPILDPGPARTENRLATPPPVARYASPSTGSVSSSSAEPWGLQWPKSRPGPGRLNSKPGRLPTSTRGGRRLPVGLLRPGVLRRGWQGVRRTPRCCVAGVGAAAHSDSSSMPKFSGGAWSAKTHVAEGTSHNPPAKMDIGPT